MNEHPILFSTEMVKAILDGRKTMTRRVVKPQPKPFNGGIHPNHEAIHPAPYIDSYCSERKTEKNPRGMSKFWCWWTEDNRQGPDAGKCPYGQPGDLLWVRETWGYWQDDGETLGYRADFPNGAEVGKPNPYEYKWRPSIHMPRWASRITLEVTGVRVERAQDISEDDAIAEGMEVVPIGTATWTNRQSFSILWDKINEKRGYSWDSNPWVWVVEFKRVKP